MLVSALVMAVMQIKPLDWIYAMPLLSQHGIITQLGRGESVPPWQHAASVAATMEPGLLLAWLAFST